MIIIEMHSFFSRRNLGLTEMSIQLLSTENTNSRLKSYTHTLACAVITVYSCFIAK